MCGSSDSVEPIRTPEPPRTLSQEAPEAPKKETRSALDSQSSRAARGTKKYKTEGDLAISPTSAVPAPTGIKI